MKRINLLLVLIFGLVGQLFAGPVDAKRAKAFASQFIKVEQEAFRSTQTNLLEVAPAYYVFKGQGNKGFVIVSGEDRLPLLIGYTDKGAIDQKNLPIQLKVLLEQYKKRVAELRKTPDNGALRSQKIFMHKPKIVVEALTKSKWGQDAPFNHYCPEMSNGEKAVTGCVATAISQVMYYHKWPVKGEGAFAYTPPAYGSELSSIFSQHTYQWDTMKAEFETQWVPHPTKPGWSIQKLVYTDEEAEAVGRLMSDVGIAVSMNYNTSANGGSGTATQYGVKALNEYFGYTSRYLERDEATGNQFMSTIKSELDAQHPMVLSGSGQGAGHAWVIDGYDENDYLHCNWGWSGLADGFFNLNFMVPSSLGIGGGSGTYNDGQGILIAVPNKSGNSTPTSEPNKLSFIDGGKLTINSNDGFLKNDPMEYNLKNVGLSISNSFTGEVGLAVYDEMGTMVIESYMPFNLSLSKGQYYQSLDWNLTLGNLVDGAYEVRAISKEAGGSAVVLGGANTIKIEIVSGAVYKRSDSSEYKFKLSVAPRQDVQAYTDTEGVSTIEVENQSSIYVKANLGITLKNIATQQTYTKKLDEVRLPAFGQAVLHPKYNLSGLGLSAGRYEVSFHIYVMETVGSTSQEVQKVVENTFGTYEIEVLDANTLPKLVCKGLEITQNNEELDSYHLTPEMMQAGSFKFSAKVQNKGTVAFNGKLTYRLKNLENNQTTALGELTSVNIAAGQELTKDVTADLSTLSLVDGAYRIELIAEHNSTEMDVWSPNLKRHNFMLKTSAQKVVLPTLTATNGTLAYVGYSAGDEVEVGTEIQIEATPNQNYRLKSLTVNGVDISSTMKFTVAENNDIVAEFEQKVPTALQGLNKANVQLYPNPATDYVELKGFTPKAEVHLLTMTGKLVLRARLSAEGSLKLNVSDLARGLYILRSGKFVKKLQVQ